MTTVKTRKKLIEVAIPLEAINVASAKEKSIRHGHPSTLHLYWARRPLAAARAVIFAQMVDDPSANPELFPTEKAQDKERKRLFKIIEDLVQWENTTKETVLQAAREEIWASWRRTAADNADHPRAKDLFDRNKLPAFHDPFAGGGALPLEAQRLGLESHATDLNPVAVMINKAMIEIPPKFAGSVPVNPESRKDVTLINREWTKGQGLAADVRFYGQWMRDEAQKRIGHLYPRIKVTDDMVRQRPDLKEYLGQELTVIAWIWARTVRSPNPAYSSMEVPLASTFMLSNKDGKEAYIEPVVESSTYRFEVKVGKPTNVERAKNGTKLARGANFQCLMSSTPIDGDYIKAEGKAGRIGSRLMAIVAEGDRGRIYLAPTREHEEVARMAKPGWKPDVDFFQQALGFRVGNYGMTKWSDLFTNRQIVALSTFSDLVHEVREKLVKLAICADAESSSNQKRGEANAISYANAVSVYLSFAVDKMTDRNSSLCGWDSSRDSIRGVFGRQAVPMVWDFAESCAIGSSAGSFLNAIDQCCRVIIELPASSIGHARQFDASTQSVSSDKVVSTDPPYYDNIGYADLSDFFYVWMRHSLHPVYPELFTTIAVPKTEELVATPARHGGARGAEAFFLEGMTKAMGRIAEQVHPAFPVTIYYAFKQSETETNAGTASTGWETFLDAVIRAGFTTTGTWPMRTELGNRMRGTASNALASSIVLVCRKRVSSAPTITRREFVAALKDELPAAVVHMQRGNIAPVDLAQAAIGPGIAVYTRYAKVIGADGTAMTVREALTQINEVLDEQLTEQEGNWDADSRWGVTWFDQHGFAPGDFGMADQLAKAKNTSVSGVVQAGFLQSAGGKVRLLKPDELPSDWAPETDDRLTVWEMLHHLIRLQKQGEASASAMLARLGDKADSAKELAYRLYGICEKKKRSTEGQLYNDLIAVWPDLVNQSKQASAPAARPGEFELDV